MLYSCRGVFSESYERITRGGEWEMKEETDRLSETKASSNNFAQS